LQLSINMFLWSEIAGKEVAIKDEEPLRIAGLPSGNIRAATVNNYS
jgi:hypothetical protein